MKYCLAVILLSLAACCPSHLDSIQKLEICGYGPDAILVYDADTDTLAWVDTSTLKVKVRYEHWNHK